MLDELKPGMIILIDIYQAEVLQANPEGIEVRYLNDQERVWIPADELGEVEIVDDSRAIEVERIDLVGSVEERRRAEVDFLDE